MGFVLGLSCSKAEAQIRRSFPEISHLPLVSQQSYSHSSSKLTSARGWIKRRIQNIQRPRQTRQPGVGIGQRAQDLECRGGVGEVFEPAAEGEDVEHFGGGAEVGGHCCCCCRGWGGRMEGWGGG